MRRSGVSQSPHTKDPKRTRTLPVASGARQVADRQRGLLAGSTAARYNRPFHSPGLPNHKENERI